MVVWRGPVYKILYISATATSGEDCVDREGVSAIIAGKMPSQAPIVERQLFVKEAGRTILDGILMFFK